MGKVRLSSKSSDLNYPTAKPTLDLNFAATKTLDPRITFTRASTGTYVGADGLIKTAVNNQPRFDHDPATGESLGLLIEESKTNVWTYSENFGVYYNGGVSIIANINDTTTPNGTNTANKIIPSTSNNLHNFTDLTTRGSGTFTFSVYAKFAGYPRLGLRVYDGTAYRIRVTFDISNGTIASLEAGTAVITPVGNGWYRCSCTGTSASGNMGTVAGWTIESLPNGLTVQTAFTGDGVSGVYLWGAQVETGALTSYIPTSGSSVTRAADTANITGTNFSSWYNNNEGTTYFEAKVRTDTLGFVTHGFLSQEATGHYRCGVYSSNWYAWTPGVGSIGDVGDGGPVINGKNKGAFAYDKNAPILTNSFNGRSVGSLSGRVPVSPTSVPLVYSPVSVQVIRLTYYPKRLTNAELQQLTK